MQLPVESWESGGNSSNNAVGLNGLYTRSLLQGICCVQR